MVNEATLRLSMDPDIVCRVYPNGSAMLTTTGKVSVFVHLDPTQFKKLVLDGAEALGIPAFEQETCGNGGDGRGLAPKPEHLLAVRRAVENGDVR